MAVGLGNGGGDMVALLNDYIILLVNFELRMCDICNALFWSKPFPWRSGGFLLYIFLDTNRLVVDTLL